MTQTIIHVNRTKIRLNRQDGGTRKPLTVRRGSYVEEADGVDILDAQGATVGRVMYSPDEPLECGAVAWVEAWHGVKVAG